MGGRGGRWRGDLNSYVLNVGIRNLTSSSVGTQPAKMMIRVSRQNNIATCKAISGARRRRLSCLLSLVSVSPSCAVIAQQEVAYLHCVVIVRQ